MKKQGANAPGVAVRRVAIEALQRITQEGAYANLALPSLLRDSALDQRDRAFVTELVYGTTRYLRACDWVIDHYVDRELDAPVRAALRVGTYQLHFMKVAPHAAVSATVGAVSTKTRGFVNAVLRRVAKHSAPWPSDAVRLSYPDWLVEQLVDDLGTESAIAALTSMNTPAQRHQRADGYTQDLASQWVSEYVGAQAGELVLDVCAAPGGKATAMAKQGATVVASDLRQSRVSLVASNVAATKAETVRPIVSDGTIAPFRAASFDRVLLDAPCSGLGVLRRRADARWRIKPEDVERLTRLQRSLIDEAVTQVKPGGYLFYSVCTLTNAETLEIDNYFASKHPNFVPLDRPDSPWQPWGRGALLLPQVANSDGMWVLGLKRNN